MSIFHTLIPTTRNDTFTNPLKGGLSGLFIAMTVSSYITLNTPDNAPEGLLFDTSVICLCHMATGLAVGFLLGSIGWLIERVRPSLLPLFLLIEFFNTSASIDIISNLHPENQETTVALYQGIAAENQETTVALCQGIAAEDPSPMIILLIRAVTRVTPPTLQEIIPIGIAIYHAILPIIVTILIVQGVSSFMNIHHEPPGNHQPARARARG